MANATTPIQAWVTSLKSLSNIQASYEKVWNDPLSERLFEWIDQTIDVAYNSMPTSDIAAIEVIAKASLEDLKSNVLVANKGGKTLRDPKLDRQIWVWENDDLKLWNRQGLKDISPFDGEAVCIIDHLFAKAVLDWMQTLPFNQGTSGFALAVASDVDTDVEKQLKLLYWGKALETARFTKAADKQRARIKDLTKKVKEAADVVNAGLEQEVVAAAKRREDNKAAIQAREEAIAAQFQGLKVIALRPLADTQEKLQGVAKEVAKLEERKISNEEKIAELVQQVIRRQRLESMIRWAPAISFKDAQEMLSDMDDYIKRAEIS